jgi:hypothetical protein
VAVDAGEVCSGGLDQLSVVGSESYFQHVKKGCWHLGHPRLSSHFRSGASLSANAERLIEHCKWSPRSPDSHNLGEAPGGQPASVCSDTNPDYLGLRFRGAFRGLDRQLSLVSGIPLILRSNEWQSHDMIEGGPEGPSNGPTIWSFVFAQSKRSTGHWDKSPSVQDGAQYR